MPGGGYDDGPYVSQVTEELPHGPEGPYTSQGAQGIVPSGFQMATTPNRNPPNPSEPSENLVSVFCENNPNYRLAMRTDGIVLAFKNLEDPKQQWMKIDMGDKLKDQEGYPAFVLVNRSSGMALSHGADNVVIPQTYDANSLDGSILWSQGRDEGNGYTAIRLLTNIHLNLDADHGHKKYGGVEDGNRLLIFRWNEQENQKWKIVPIGSDE